MERQTFILLNKRTWCHNVTIFLKGVDGKVDKRNLKFATEHKVSEQSRTTTARTVAGDFSTSDEVIIDALYHDSSYGKTFVHVDDPEGKRKKTPYVITKMDAEKTALRNLFEASGFEFDETKSNDVLNKEFQILMGAKSGVVIKESSATEIKHTPVDIEKQMVEQAEAARKVYEERYGEPVPTQFHNDKAFLSALSDPNWDAKAYIAEKSKVVDPSALPDNAEALQEIYHTEFGKKVANLKKNDIGWMKKQIEEKRAAK